MSCCDRNRIALQSNLLSAAALGIGNVLLLTGDHQRFGDDQQTMGVFDLDGVSLLAMARRMRDNGELLSGQKILAPPRLFLGAAANPEGEPLDLQVLRLEKKVAAGVDFIRHRPSLIWTPLSSGWPVSVLLVCIKNKNSRRGTPAQLIGLF